MPTSKRVLQLPVALTIAGSDSGGGAGIQADLRTFDAFGIHGVSVITALTAQNTRGVSRIELASPPMLRAQLDAVFDDFPIAAIKLGMLGSSAVATIVADALAKHPRIPVVLDPVLVATTGAALAKRGLVATIERRLLARAAIVTPNLPEAEAFLGRPIESSDAMREAAADLIERGARAVLLKGGHARGQSIADLLVTDAGERWFRHARLPLEGHGTGCTTASAIAAGLASGRSLETAVADAIRYVQRALALAYRPGRGRVHVLGRPRVRGSRVTRSDPAE